MRIRKIDTQHKRDVKQFVGFPFELYRGDPLWVPPLLSSARQILNRHKHPFYRHSTADFFVAESQGQTVGRIAAMQNRRYNAHRGSQAAFFGYFEAVDDVEVARRLFDAVFDWARARGLEEVIGPKGLLGTEGGGVLVEGFEHRPALGVTYNPPYYDPLIRDAGFEKDTDYSSGLLDQGFRLPERVRRVAEKVKKRRGFWIKSFRSKREMRRWVPRVVRAHQKAFRQTHTYYPPTDGEIAMIVDTLLGVAEPRYAKLVMAEQEIVGFAFIYPDISAALQKTGGRLWPLGWLALLRERKRTRWANGNGLGVLPAYQGLGANVVLYAELAKTMQKARFEHLALIQVEESNFKSLADMETLGARWTVRHRGYRRILDGSHA